MLEINSIPPFVDFLSEMQNSERSFIVIAPGNFGTEHLEKATITLADSLNVKLHQFKVSNLCENNQIRYHDILRAIDNEFPSLQVSDPNIAGSYFVDIVSRLKIPRWLIFSSNEGHSDIQIRIELLDTLNQVIWKLDTESKIEKIRVIVFSDLLFNFCYEDLRSKNGISRWDYLKFYEFLKYDKFELSRCLNTLKKEGLFSTDTLDNETIYNLTGGHVGLVLEVIEIINSHKSKLDLEKLEELLLKSGLLRSLTNLISQDETLSTAASFQESKIIPSTHAERNLLNVGVILKENHVFAKLCEGVIGRIAINQFIKRKNHMEQKQIKHLPLKLSISLMVLCLMASIGLFLFLFRLDSQVFSQGYYLVVVLLGISASGILFGAFDTYIELTGSYLGWGLRAGGPAAFAILIIAGGYYFQLPEKDITPKMEFSCSQDKINIKNAIQSVYLKSQVNGATYNSTSISEAGMVTFDPIPYNLRTHKFRISVVSRDLEIVEPDKDYYFDKLSFFKVTVLCHQSK